MSRMQTLFAVVLPSMLAGGVLFGSAFSSAEAGLQVGFWPDDPATVVAQGAPVPPVPPAPRPAPRPTPRVGPVPPVPPVPLITPDIRKMVDEQIQQAIDQVKNNTQLPAAVRDKILKRLEKVREKTAERLKHIDVNNVEELGDQMGEVGDEIGAEMEQFGEEMSQWGEKFGEQLGDKISKQVQRDLHAGAHHGMHVHIATGHDDGDDDDDDDDDQLTSVPDVADQDDLDDAVADLGDLSLKPPQRDQIQRLRADSDRQVAVAKKALDQATAALKKQLDNVGASDAELAKAIDAVSQQEAAIRKARILAWHDARRVLDDAQRKKVMDAAKPKTK